ncbi:LPXTG cell wall anchor domain-containing protein [Streptomyces sp. NPDC006711]|uniref:LPXTG cell wall anchor domain-containing protein n=1 Tax=unclassified Streptomyces TaxID=2593676 RepID=UPI0033D6E262
MWRRPLDTVENHNVTVPQHSPAKTDPRRPRRLAGAAAATGLLLALAAPALAGPAHAEGPGVEARSVAPAPVAQHRDADASSPVKRAGESKVAAARPSPAATEPPTAPQPKRPQGVEPSVAPQPKQPQGVEPTAAPAGGGAEPSAAPSAPAAAPAPADQKELAHTGSSTATTVMGVGAGALILVGLGTVYAVRRRHAN